MGLGLLGLFVLGLVAALASTQVAPDGAQRRVPQAAAGSAGVTWREPIEVARGPAYRGPWRMNDSEFHYVDDPTVAVDDTGRIAVVWANQMRQDIFFQAYDAAGEATVPEPVNVSRSPDVFSWLPRVAIPTGDPGRVYVLWQEIIFSGGSHGGEIFFARSIDGGRSFESPVNLSGTIAGDGKGRLSSRRWDNGSLDLAVGPDGGIHAAWTEYEGGLWFSRSTDHGASFSQPVRLAGGGDAKPARGPALAVDAAGAVYLAWTVGEDRAADIHLARSVDQGRSFSEPQIVSPGDGHADAPKLAVDGRGTVHLVYAESPAGPFERYHIRYTRSADGGTTFEAPRKISSPHSEQFESVSFPDLSLDGADNPYVVWELFPGRGHRPQGLGFAYSSDGGRTFTSPTIVPGSVDPALGVNGSQQGLLMSKLAVNGAGAVAVANSTFKRHEASHIWLFRGQRAGR